MNEWVCSLLLTGFEEAGLHTVTNRLQKKRSHPKKRTGYFYVVKKKKKK
jgi:hypothetical protein